LAIDARRLGRKCSTLRFNSCAGFQLAHESVLETDRVHEAS
jgi:hypothetical protein